MTQPHLIESILKDLRLDGDDAKTKETPAMSSAILSSHLGAPEFDEHFHYRSVIGKLNYLKKKPAQHLICGASMCQVSF